MTSYNTYYQSNNNYSRNTNQDNNQSRNNQNNNHSRNNQDNNHSRNNQDNNYSRNNQDNNQSRNKTNNQSTLTLENSLNKISFCDKECFNINNNHTKELIVNHIQTKYKIKIIDREYVSLNPHMMRNISNHEHYLATYSNGNPYLLWFTNIDNKNCAIFIDRKLKTGYSYPKIHLVQYEFDDIVFKNEFIFTGELVRDVNREWQYLISDLIVYEGENIIKTQNILSRFNLIYQVLDNHYTPNIKIESCPLYVKKLWQYAEFDKLVNEFIPSLSYICKGIVFYTMNSQFSSYAWIMPRESQISVDDAKVSDIKFYEKYPHYKEIGALTPNTRADNNDSHITSHVYNVVSVLYNYMKDTIITDASNKFILDDALTLSMLSKVEKCITNICNESSASSITSTASTTNKANTQITKDNIKDLKLDKYLIYKSTIPGIFKVYDIDNTNEDKGILYIPYLKMENEINKLFNSSPDIHTVTMYCIYYELYNKWIPISYSIS